MTNNETGVTVSGTFTGNGGGLTNVPADWQTVSGTSQTAAANYAYLLTNNSLSTLTLPAAPNVGDIVTVSGSGANGWQVVPNAGQTIAGHAIPAGVVWTAQNGSPTEIWPKLSPHRRMGLNLWRDPRLVPLMASRFCRVRFILPGIRV